MHTLSSARVRAPLPRDLAIALLVAVLLEVGFLVSLNDDDDVVLPPPDPAGRLLLSVGALSLAFRRVVPLTVLAVNGGGDLAYQALGYRPTPLPLGVLIALYTVALACRPLISGAATAVYVTALTLGSLTGATPLDDDHVYVYLVSVGATLTVTYGVALGRARATLAEARAADLAREHDIRTRAAVAQEQARIARDVHDIVANEVSVMVAQAAAARRVMDRQPQAAGSALASIETVGRDALDGLRRLLTLLRTDGAGAGSAPPPDLERLPWLLAQVDKAGLPVDLVTRGTPRRLAATVEFTAFRIVQEALTNSLKHAGPTSATVTMTYGEDFLGVEVQDHGCGGASTSTRGYGLISMRERAALVGGDVETGSDGVQGFRVHARLPVAGGAP